MNKKMLLPTITMMLIIAVPCFGQWSDQTSNVSNDLNAVFFIDENTGWIVGRQGKVLNTTNGGGTWSLQNSGTNEDLNKVYMVNSTTGYAVGDNGTFIKYDGSDWSTIDINFSQDMHGVHFLDADTGWISGDWGRIMKTMDGGNSWTIEMDNSTFTNLFYDLHMIDASIGWAVGTSGKVLKYDGSSWSNQNTPAGDDLFAVDFSSQNNGFMVGDQSNVYQYDGAGWSQHSTSLSSTSYDIEDVDVIDGNTAYAATAITGGGGIILKYNGTSWNTEYENTDFMKTELFYGIHFSSDSTGHTVGAGGMVKVKGSVTSSIETYTDNQIKASITPNPVNTFARIEYWLEKESDAKVKITDITGREIRMFKQNAQKGMNSILIDLREEEAGIYNVQIATLNNYRVVKLLKL